MSAENSSDAQVSRLRDRLYQFLLGAAAGLVFSLVPLYFVWISAAEVKSIETLLIAGFAIACGIASAFWGKPFLSRLLDLLNHIPPIA
ncbi:hypothetical protein H6F67_03970 [Microcoleus sp. FACHB-1515]|uniref:hypothetical protein n=1 Tax=Cyanophyceae TaxID=3028117 RepID=UPI001684145E|nr:hypothetical protein [Microcoleus sp. FACHB-1515]MBD2089010.1 hypothetical protein [Microcoleus sp. FACHB-1515]